MRLVGGPQDATRSNGQAGHGIRGPQPATRLPSQPRVELLNRRTHQRGFTRKNRNKYRIRGLTLKETEAENDLLQRPGYRETKTTHLRLPRSSNRAISSHHIAKLRLL